MGSVWEAGAVSGFCSVIINVSTLFESLGVFGFSFCSAKTTVSFFSSLSEVFTIAESAFFISLFVAAIDVESVFLVSNVISL